MTREQAAKLLPVIQAFAEGKAIQVRTFEGAWEDYRGHDANFSNTENWIWRIKPEPREWWLVGNKSCPTMPWGVWNTQPAQFDPIGSEIVHVREVIE